MSTATDESYVRFVDERSAELMRLAYQLTRNHEDARDLVQTALERGYRKWHKIDPQAGDGFGYIRQILVNAHTDGLRRKMRWDRKAGHRDVEAPEPVMSDGEVQPVSRANRSPETLALGRQQLRENLGLLTERERTAVILRFGEDLSESEVAQYLGISVGTVKSTVSRALAKLRVSPAAQQVALDTVEPRHPHQQYQRPQKGGRS